jgi:hypothetical protein
VENPFGTDFNGARQTGGRRRRGGLVAGAEHLLPPPRGAASGLHIAPPRPSQPDRARRRCRLLSLSPPPDIPLDSIVADTYAAIGTYVR